MSEFLLAGRWRGQSFFAGFHLNLVEKAEGLALVDFFPLVSGGTVAVLLEDKAR